jgi:hypothetical protein
MKPQLLSSDELNYIQRQVVQCVTFYIGASLDNREDELRRFIARGVDDPATILNKHVSDCGLFALAVWYAVDVQDTVLGEKYQIGKAIEWLVEIAARHNAVRHIMKDGPPTVGALMHYYTHGKNDNHVEFLLSPPVKNKGWIAEHGGGGRADCGIGSSTSDILWNVGRPLQEWYDISTLCDV